jgi:hypothetical protein
MICSRLLPSALVLCFASRASSQLSPRVSGSLLLGTEKTTGGEFRSRNGIAGELAVTWRIAAVHDVAVTTTGALGGLLPTGDVTTICIPSSHGGCRPSGADLGGPSLRVGVERFFNHVGLAASLGTGWYGKRNGPGGAHAFPLTVAVTVPVVPHVALMAQGERIVFRDFGGENFHADAFLVGLRVP